MSWIEDELRVALQRREPPDGFAQRVIGRARRPRPQWRFVAIAAAILLIFSVGLFRYQKAAAERRSGEVARQQLVLAIQIAAGKLETVKYRINSHAAETPLEIPANDEKGNDRQL